MPKEPGGHKASARSPFPGYFKIRSRFADFTGQYVIHFHILAHEDRGMIQLVKVIPEASPPQS